MVDSLILPGLGDMPADAGMTLLRETDDGRFIVGQDGVIAILATGDRKVAFVAFAEQTLAYVASSLGYPAYYPVHPTRLDKPVRAVLMDLDGTSVHSETFWIWIIQQTVGSLLGNPDFKLESDDFPFVSGHSVSEHLQYCLSKYVPDETVETARRVYFEHTQREIAAILAGGGQVDAFTPAPGLKRFLLALREMGVKIGLVTSGLYEKAFPEILAAFRAMEMGDPRDFYDAIITAGYPLRDGEPGTLGELSPKPHPWLYAEIARVGLGIPFEQRHHVVGIEDSAAGICAIRLAGFSAIGVAGGNIIESGVRTLCDGFCESLDEVLGLVG